LIEKMRCDLGEPAADAAGIDSLIRRGKGANFAVAH
jgi:hypothetical protein